MFKIFKINQLGLELYNFTRLKGVVFEIFWEKNVPPNLQEKPLSTYTEYASLILVQWKKFFQKIVIRYN